MEHRLQAEVATLLLDHLNVEVPSVHDDLIEIGLLDSLRIVELLVELEHRFDMRIPLVEVDIDSFRSVAKIADFITRMKISGTTPAAGVASLTDQARPSPPAD